MWTIIICWKDETITKMEMEFNSNFPDQVAKAILRNLVKKLSDKNQFPGKTSGDIKQVEVEKGMFA
ncbi:MAG: hypothetical protein C0399_06730 [Syntrophus sp. (in: bacteria)]|nr:hypothetical protein [Syntrophus sp. (in: bacteria)]